MKIIFGILMIILTGCGCSTSRQVTYSCPSHQIKYARELLLGRKSCSKGCTYYYEPVVKVTCTDDSFYYAMRGPQHSGPTNYSLGPNWAEINE